MPAKIALVFPSNPWYCPYVSIYTAILDKHGIEYDQIYWNRFNDTISNDLVYEDNSKKSTSNDVFQLLRYLKFCRFVKKKIKQHKYDKIIVFSSNIGIFCQSFLERNYKNNYIFDFRDLLIEQKKIFKNKFNKVLQNSYANVISSPGFKKCLPLKYKYYISHNFIKDKVLEAINKQKIILKTSPIKVLTIGGIRIDANPEIILSLGNKANVELDFIGRGLGTNYLQELSNNHNFSNIKFEGYYEKKDEADLIRESTFLNIYYQNVLTHKTAMSNRFYNSLIYRRPMIVTKGQIQGDFCEKYNLGLTISNTEGLNNKLFNWIQNTNMDDYDSNCRQLLSEFLKDDEEFSTMVLNFITN